MSPMVFLNGSIKLWSQFKMHPAPSVIIFTTLSGLGFGLLAFLCLGYPSMGGLVGFVFFAIGFGLAIGGLLSSTFHNFT